MKPYILLSAVLSLLCGETLSLPGLPTSLQHILSDGYDQAASASGDGWYVKEQDERLCDAASRHFAGQINVTDDKSIFFWFFESRQSPRDDPVVIWLNGGPGASSLPGLFGEVGPCSVNSAANGTIFQEASWTNHANVLFIDQPAGVGFSLARHPSAIPSSLPESSPDFITTLQVFFGEIFTQFASNALYIAGESFGGRYAPYYAADILRTQRQKTAGSLEKTPLAGLILVDAMVDSNWEALGQYHLFCTDNHPNVLRFNETACRAMAAAAPECERLLNICQSSYDEQICKTATEYCEENLGKYYQQEVEAHRRSPYDMRRDCPEPPLCGVGENITTGSTSDFLNTPSLQSLLGFTEQIKYQGINFDLNQKWADNNNIYLPTTRSLTYLLDGGSSDSAKNLAISPIPVLILTGDYDVGINIGGGLLQYDNLPWHGQAGYRANRSLKPWYWSDAEGNEHEGGLRKGISEGKGLNFVTIHDAGHMAPGDQREAVAYLVGRWLAGEGTLPNSARI